MGIEKKVFFELWTDLINYFNQKNSTSAVASERILKAQYQYLSQRMSTSEFESAFYLAVNQLARMPRPEDVLNLVRGNIEQRAIAQWEAATIAIRNAPRNASEEDLINLYESVGIDAIAALTIRDMGGLTALGNCSVNDLHWRRKDFIQSYQQLSTTPQVLMHPELKGGSIRAMLPKASTPENMGAIAQRLLNAG